jgi:N-acetylglutamate synthase-like GNAT family acetyltransferase
MKLRDVRTEDLKPITNLIIKCSEQFILPRFNEEGRQTYLLSHSLEAMRERLGQFQYQVLEQNGEIIGVVGMRRPSHLFHLHVASEYHGQGLGKHLWNAARARALQLDRPDRFTVNSSIYAVPFYEKLGFVAENSEIRGGVEYVPMSMSEKQAGSGAAGKTQKKVRDRL